MPFFKRLDYYQQEPQLNLPVQRYELHFKMCCKIDSLAMNITLISDCVPGGATIQDLMGRPW